MFQIIQSPVLSVFKKISLQKQQHVGRRVSISMSMIEDREENGNFYMTWPNVIAKGRLRIVLKCR